MVLTLEVVEEEDLMVGEEIDLAVEEKGGVEVIHDVG